MNKFSFLFSIVLGLGLISCEDSDKGSTTAVTTTDETLSRIEVIDFHSTHRCKTCNAIEANTKYTLETFFAEDLKSDRITFQTINVDEESNFEIAEKYEAFGTALFLNVISNGEENQIDLTEFAFMKGNDQAEFSDELKSKIETELVKI